MSDFDFDELDRAVTNALDPEVPVYGQQANEAGNTTAPDAHVYQQAQTAPAEAQPAAPFTAQPAATNAPVATAAAVSSAPAARRSSGRFMDVVHPSSDMRPGQSNPSAPLANPKPAAVQSQPEPPAAPVIPDIDPLALIEEDWQKPLESPFLSDAKVEKRPLGGEAPTATPDYDLLDHLLEAPDNPRIEVETMPDPIDFAAQIEAKNESPEGLNQSLLEEPEVDIEAVVADEPSGTNQVAEDDDDDDSAFGYGQGTFQPDTKDDVPAGPTSINQQYETQPSSSPESGAIYDTESYHKPLTPVAKKKSGAFAILWILLILVLGGGAGAAFYFYVLPLL